MKLAWVVGARPRTLPAAVVPVAVATAVVAAQGEVRWGRAALSLLVSLALQVGVNYANDYSDGIRGTDDARVGPLRLVASGTKSPTAVKRAAFAAFGVACVAGLVLAEQTTWWLLAVGAAAVAAGWFYTGGPRPYGYSGFGELFVFIFFGLVAVVGSAYVQLGRVTLLAVAAAIPVGLLAVALLVVNNLRDIPGDTVAGKRTLAVRLGDPSTRALYGACLLVPFGLVPMLAFVDGRHLGALIALAALPLAIVPLRLVVGGAAGSGLIAVLAKTAQVQLVFGALLSFGLSR